MAAGSDLFLADHWQMAYGERAAIEGILASLRPALAIELGTADGGSLARIAALSAEVHTFDLHPPAFPLPPNVHAHTGDSHVLLPRLLADFAAEGRNVEFALVDGDHSADGVQRDLTDLLESAAVQRAAIVLHDMHNEAVRRGVRAIDFARHPKVAYVDLGFVELPQQPGVLGDRWGGLGLVVVDPDGSLVPAGESRPVIRDLQAPDTPLRRAVAPLRELRRRARAAVSPLARRLRQRR